MNVVKTTRHFSFGGATSRTSLDKKWSFLFLDKKDLEMDNSDLPEIGNRKMRMAIKQI